IKCLSAEQQDGLQKTLTKIELPTCFASVKKDGEIISLGLGVLSESHMGLFDFMTDPAHQRRGYAAVIVKQLLQKAKSRGVQKAYLQVVRDNEEGLKFWSALGFASPLYSYYYCTKPGE
ncbi:MAG: GNAT family N-acetyltransferase, partial [Sneathiella sp.]